MEDPPRGVTRRGRAHKAPGGAACSLVCNWKGCTKRPIAATPPAHRRHTATIQLPTLCSPPGIRSARRCTPLDRPCGRWRAAAYGPRVRGPAPRTTPTNGGYHRAAPLRNLCIRSGQRPSIHRPHQRRARRSTRASVAIAPRTGAPAVGCPHELERGPEDLCAMSHGEAARLAGKKMRAGRAHTGSIAPPHTSPTAGGG